MLFCNLNNKIQTNSHTLVNSFRGKIKTKLSLTNQSPLYVDVTSQTKSVCWSNCSRVRKSLGCVRTCCWFKGLQSGYTMDAGVRVDTPSLAIHCLSASPPWPWTRASSGSSACRLSPSSARACCSFPICRQGSLTFRYPFHSFPSLWLPVQTGTDPNLFKLFIDV